MQIGTGALLAAVFAGAAGVALLATLGGDPPLAAGLVIVDDDGGGHGEEYEMDVPLRMVPRIVLASAMEAVNGIALDSASVELESQGLIFALEGIANGHEYEIELSPAGEVIKIEDEGEDDDEEYEMDVPLALVPDVVTTAALGAVPGLALVSASVELESEGLIFALEGSVAGREVEVEVSPDGAVLDVEQDGDDDDDDHAGDDDDDEGEDDDD